jgi:hypothetical protein
VFGKELVVTIVRRDGRVETYRVAVNRDVGDGSGGDLITRWGFLLFRCFFAEATRTLNISISFRDLTGASRSQYCITNYPYIFFGSGCTDRALFIGFGSDSSPPSRNDYRLLGELARVRASFSVDESNYVITISGSWTPDSDVMVCEVGLYIRVCDSGGVARYVLFDRSVLSPCRSVSAGETVVASYVFRF